MNSWLMVFLVSIVLGAVFTGSSYFVSKEEDVFTACRSGRPISDSYQTSEQTKNGFPFYFYVSQSQKPDSQCQSSQGADLSAGSVVTATGVHKDNLTEDLAIWSSVFFVIGALLFGVRKKQT
jgi:hypothetical protein